MPPPYCCIQHCHQIYTIHVHQVHRLNAGIRLLHLCSDFLRALSASMTSRFCRIQLWCSWSLICNKHVVKLETKPLNWNHKLIGLVETGTIINKTKSLLDPETSWVIVIDDAISYILLINPESAHTIFKRPFLHEKGFWRSKISWLFLIHYELSEDQKKIGFSQCFGVI